jgi:hypothetical protein
MMALLLRPTRGGGGGGSSDPPAGSEGGVRWQLSGTGAGSGPQASVVRSRVLPLQRCFGSPVVAARDVGGACCGLGTARVAVQCLRVCRRAVVCAARTAGSGGAELGQCLVGQRVQMREPEISPSQVDVYASAEKEAVQTAMTAAMGCDGSVQRSCGYFLQQA